MDGYQNLANAIIILATKDYRKELKRIKKNPSNRDAMDQALACERFFTSPWFAELTEVEGSWLMEQLRREVACA